NDSPARPSHKARKAEGSHDGPLAERPVVLDFDPHAGAGGAETHPEALLHETPASYEEAQTAVRRAMQPASRPTRKAAKPTGPKKLFVLDTNVLMHDPMSLFRFEEHDIFLPMIVLEELDGHKKGTTEVARNARQASRSLDALAAVRSEEHTSELQSRGH